MTLKSTVDYFRNPLNFATGWSERAELAAKYINPASVVLDLGCGPYMALKALLPDGCTYIPADLVQWRSHVHKADIDAGLFPDGEFDYVAVLGVIEYLERPELLFKFARRAAKAMVISYCHNRVAEQPARRPEFWVNDFSDDVFAGMIEASGWKVSRSLDWQPDGWVREIIYELAHKD
jgi:hypothetical protein